ncbi:cyclin-domain-containing protein [Scheffersomyces amazonensis]|uniref:cyclin-domain-containing protein n=1 Tax=Scheffersomyces amazonensis TaxID=1078765 RepID=UPI00315CFE67
MSYVKEISDIPLKPSQETFVDDPTSIDEVSLDELVFDIAHGIKTINNLHVFHAIIIMCTTLSDIIKLQSNRELFVEFRRQQLARYGIDLDEINQFTPPPPSQPQPQPLQPPTINSDSIMYTLNDSNISTMPPGRSATPPLSPPLKFAKLNSNTLSKEGLVTSFRESTPDSLANSDNLDDNVTDKSHPPYIPIEILVQNSCLDPIENPISDINHEKFRKEYAYNQDLKRQTQTSHLLKIFKLIKIPPLTIEQFLVRIKTYSSSISVTSYIHSASMLFKLCVLLDIVPLTQSNVYRLILASIRCSTKKLEDVYQKQKSFATVGGITTKDLFRLEVSFLYLCNFKLIIGETVFNDFLTQEFIELRQFCKLNLETVA